MENEKKTSEFCNYSNGQQDTFLKHVFSLKVDNFFGLQVDKNEFNKVNKKFDLPIVLDGFKRIHNDRYDYSKVNAKSWVELIEVKCKNCKTIFETTSTNHYHNGVCCRRCHGRFQSKGEIRIDDYLKNKGIDYKREYRFEDLDGHRFDFFIPEKNLLIEFDGEQHFKAIDFFGGKTELEVQKRRDCIKNQYAKEKGIHLVRIPYTKRNNIEKILNEII